MFQGMFQKKQTQRELSKEQLYDDFLLRVIGWKEENDIPSLVTAFADLIIWAITNSPSSIAQIKTHEVLSVLSQIYDQNQQYAIGVIQALILIFTNIKDEEFMKSILQEENVLPNIFKKVPDDFQIVSYYISLMKIISQRINTDNVNLLINEKKECLLLQRCVDLYTTDDSLAQTAIMHIILLFMKEKYTVLIPFFKETLFKKFYLQVGNQMIQLFKEMDTVVLTLRKQTMSRLTGMFEQLQDMLLFLTDLYKTDDDEVIAIVGTILYHSITLPIILSSLRIKEQGIISINLSVFLLFKLLPIIEMYKIDNKVYKAMLSMKQNNGFRFHPFNPKQQLSEKLYHLEEHLLNKPLENQIQIKTAEIRHTVFHLLTSKDDNLVYLITHLIVKLFESTRIDKTVLIECGMYLRIDEPNTNETRKKLIPIIINQLGQTFRISTLKNLGAILVKLSIIKNQFRIDGQFQYILCKVYKKMIDKGRMVLKNAEHYSYIVESFQNDERRICTRILENNQDIGYEAFLPPGEQCTTLPFFERLPNNFQQSSRYDLVVFGLLRKLRYLIIPRSKLLPSQISFEQFYQQMLTSSAADYKPGNFYEIPKTLFLPCKLVSQKALIQTYIIEDSFHFILGTQMQGRLKIIINIRYKNLNPHLDVKAGIIKIKARGYSNKDQQWRDLQDLQIKADPSMTQKIITSLVTRRDLCRQSQLSFISKLLTKSQSDIPVELINEEEKQQPQVQSIDLLGM